MKIRKLILITIILFTIQTFAQSQMNDKRDQIKSLKVGFITNELNLSTDEAAKFWPLYNAYDDRQFELKHQKMKDLKDQMDADLDKMSEKEASALITQMENYDTELYQIRKKFNSSLKGVLPAVKIIKLKKAEDNFYRKLLQQYRNKGPKK